MNARAQARRALAYMRDRPGIWVTSLELIRVAEVSEPSRAVAYVVRHHLGQIEARSTPGKFTSYRYVGDQLELGQLDAEPARDRG